MEVAGEGCNTTWFLPVGYRFIPTDEEIITYLRMRILNQPLPSNKVKDVELYHHTPQQLEEKYGEQTEKEMYFFTQRKVNSANATRANRTISNAGYWRASTKKISIQDDNGDIIGYKMLLNYYAKTEIKADAMTAWLMYEYTTPSGSKKMDELVLCKIYNKMNEQKKRIITQPENPRQNLEQVPYQFDGIVLQNHTMELKTTIYQFPDIGLHYQNVAPQAPTYQAYDVGLHNQHVQMNFTMESNVSDYQHPVVEAPIDESFSEIFRILDEPHDPEVDAELIRRYLGPKELVANVSCNMVGMDFTATTNVYDNQHPVLQVDHEPINADKDYSTPQAVAAYYENIPAHTVEHHHQNMDVQLAPTNQYNSKDDDDVDEFAQNLEEMLLEAAVG